MRRDDVDGYYVQYVDSGTPVEVLDRCAYAFSAPARTCLVRHAGHLAWFLKTERYRIIGVELTNGGVAAKAADATPETVSPRPRGRPRKDANAHRP